MAKRETVEEFLARGGKINVIPTGQGKDTPKMKEVQGVPRYVEGNPRYFNIGKNDGRRN